MRPTEGPGNEAGILPRGLGMEMEAAGRGRLDNKLYIRKFAL